MATNPDFNDPFSAFCGAGAEFIVVVRVAEPTPSYASHSTSTVAPAGA